MIIKKFDLFIPYDEGYIQKKSDLYIDIQKICTVVEDLSRNATRIELLNGKIYYVTNTVNQVLEELANV